MSFVLKDDIITIRVPGAVKEALRRAAEADARSLASLATKLLTEFVRANGYLEKSEVKPLRRKKRRS